MSIDEGKPHITYAYVVDDNETIITKEFDDFKSLLNYFCIEIKDIKCLTYIKLEYDKNYNSSSNLSDHFPPPPSPPQFWRF